MYTCGQLLSKQGKKGSSEPQRHQPKELATIMLPYQSKEEMEAEECWTQEAYQALHAYVHGGETLNGSNTNHAQGRGEPMQANQADELNVAQQFPVNEQTHNAEGWPEEELMSEELSDSDQDELVSLLNCEYCDASLLPEDDPKGQPLEYCQNDRCGMPSGIPRLADWASFVNDDFGDESEGNSCH